MRRGFILVLGIFIILAILVVGGAVWYYAAGQHGAANSRTFRPPENIFGEYVGTGCSEDNLSCYSANHVSIASGTGGQAEASIYLTFSEGYVCSLTGKISSNHGQLMLNAEGIDAADPCELDFAVSSSGLTLSDPGGRCRTVYCGAGGTFDGARFRKLPVSP